ncbi:hypothetical protein [Sphingobium sp. Cam5-1]|uniref:hypothetical protein n=1 Tax=Sphingobium sp. Cam5-1 TaxID=2789327 RepID=UPI001E49B98E|nr:hypothetical protein [Sphingobium sp. Cam5-1]
MTALLSRKGPDRCNKASHRQEKGKMVAIGKDAADASIRVVDQGMVEGKSAKLPQSDQRRQKDHAEQNAREALPFIIV